VLLAAVLFDAVGRGGDAAGAAEDPLGAAHLPKLAPLLVSSLHIFTPILPQNHKQDSGPYFREVPKVPGRRKKGLVLYFLLSGEENLTRMVQNWGKVPIATW
jgi:hypothetical protein